MKKEIILEVGSGMSPILDDSERIVYSDLSFSALRTLKKSYGRSCFVVADAEHLPFKDGSFSHVVCSEVLEHMQEDRSAMKEMAAVMKAGGSLILTFPHRKAFFAEDDRFVKHFRRYDLDDMRKNLDAADLQAVEVSKVLGPLEKVTMVSAISIMPFYKRFKKYLNRSERNTSLAMVKCFRWFNRLYCLPVWLDARLSPRFLSSVLMIHAKKKN